MSTPAHDPLAALVVLANRWDDEAIAACDGCGGCLACFREHDLTRDLRAAITEAREALGTVTVREEWRIHSADGEASYATNADHPEAEKYARLVAGSQDGTYAVRRIITTTHHETDWEEA